MTQEELRLFNQKKKIFAQEIKTRNDNLKNCINYLNKLDLSILKNLKDKIDDRGIKVIYVVGMGSSYYAGEYIYTKCQASGILLIPIEAAMFLKTYVRQVDQESLVIIISNSGNSEEIVEVADKLKDLELDENVLSITNNTNGYLFKMFPNKVLIQASPEYYIAHSSYLNTILVLDFVINYLLDIDQDNICKKINFDLLTFLDQKLQLSKGDILNIFADKKFVDVIYASGSKFNSDNAALLLREGSGLMTNSFSENEYTHGEHLVEVKNKILCFLGTDYNGEKYNFISNEIMLNDNLIISSGKDLDIFKQGNTIRIVIPESIRHLGEMIVFNTIVAWRMEECNSDN